MRIQSEWLVSAPTQSVLKLLTDAGLATFAVGGCVRNTLMGLPVGDIDIATAAHPEKVMELAAAAGLKAIPTGIDFGTVTVISGNTAFEITTFRRDISSDGRHAVVAFSEDILADAGRRDFTINALYCGADGAVIDPLDGIADIHARRLRFIGDANRRIREDFLRILRYFRFYALYCDPLNGIDAEALAAISNNIDGLNGLSAERVGAEMRKLLAAEDPAPAMATMMQSGVMAQILPGANAEFLAPLVALELAEKIKPSWLRRLAVTGARDVSKNLCLSGKERKYLTKLEHDLPLAEAAYRLGGDIALDKSLIQAASLGIALPPDFQNQIAIGSTAKFPVRAADLMPKIAPGPALGAELRRLENLWIKSGFALDKSELL